MEVPVEVELQGIDDSAQIRNVISKHVDALEAHFGRITAARVALKSPGGHHRQGGLPRQGTRPAAPARRAGRIVGLSRHLFPRGTTGSARVLEG